MIQRISEWYGDKKETGEGHVYYAFPRAEQLVQASEEELRALKLGYRSKYLCNTAEMVAEGTVNLEKIKEMSYDEAKKELLKLSVQVPQDFVLLCPRSVNTSYRQFSLSLS